MQTTADDNEQYSGFIWFKTLVGSRAYGLHNDTSDYDWRGWYCPPTEHVLSLQGVPEQIIQPQGDDVAWELAKFINLLRAGNPNVLETIYGSQFELPYHEHSAQNDAMHGVAMEIVFQRDQFLSKRIIATYGGYATAQWGRGLNNLSSTDPHTVANGWKHLMHLIRLLIAGIQALKGGGIRVDMSEYRDKLLQIRRGEWAIADVERWYRTLDDEFNDWKTRTKLPDQPNNILANDLLLRARAAMWTRKI